MAIPAITTLFDNVDTSTTYIGTAAGGSLSGEAKWNIMKISYDAGGNVVSVMHANGDGTPDKIWDNRTTYTYA